MMLSWGSTSSGKTSRPSASRRVSTDSRLSSRSFNWAISHWKTGSLRMRTPNMDFRASTLASANVSPSGVNANTPSFAGTRTELDVFGLSLAGHRGVNMVDQLEEQMAFSLSWMRQRDLQIRDHSSRIFVHDDDPVRHRDGFFDVVCHHENGFC